MAGFLERLFVTRDDGSRCRKIAAGVGACKLMTSASAFFPALTHAEKHAEKHAKKHVERHAEMHVKKQAKGVSFDRAGEWALVKGPAPGGCPAA
jgi:hypothetical protein